MKTLVLGLGNTILSDDGVGIIVAKELKKRLNPQDFDIKEASIAGLSLLDEISGYDRLILIDSIKTSSSPAGKLRKIELKDFGTTSHLASFHNIDFATAIELGKRVGYKIPEIIDVYAIEVDDNSTFSEELTPKVKESIPTIVDKILADIH